MPSEWAEYTTLFPESSEGEQIATIMGAYGAAKKDCRFE